MVGSRPGGGRLWWFRAQDCGPGNASHGDGRCHGDAPFWFWVLVLGLGSCFGFGFGSGIGIGWMGVVWVWVLLDVVRCGLGF